MRSSDTYITSAGSLENTNRVVSECRSELKGLSRQDMHAFLYSKISSSHTSVSANGRSTYMINIGRPGDIFLQDVCADAFCCAYGISRAYLKRVRKDYRHEVRSLTSSCLFLNDFQIVNREYNSHKNQLRNISVKEVIKIFEDNGIPISHETAACMLLPDTEDSHLLYQWLSDYFSTSCDTVPNGADIVELDWDNKKNFYGEYVFDMQQRNHSPVTSSHFYKIWNKLFSHVKIRKVKAVTGKCWECSELIGKISLALVFIVLNYA